MLCDGRVARRSTVDDAGTERHVAGCLRCQAEQAGERRIARLLGGLRDQQFSPGAGLLDDILAALDDPHTVATGSGKGRVVLIVAATMVTITGVVLLLRRSRVMHASG